MKQRSGFYLYLNFIKEIWKEMWSVFSILKLYQQEWKRVKINFSISKFLKSISLFQSLHPPKNKMKKMYLCEQCGQQASSLANLGQHMETIRNLCKYNCHQCDFQAGSPLALKRHKQIKHNFIKFNCRKCDSSYVWPENLCRHVRTKHKNI